MTGVVIGAKGSFRSLWPNLDEAVAVYYQGALALNIPNVFFVVNLDHLLVLLH
jgi:hypothetical protein